MPDGAATVAARQLATPQASFCELLQTCLGKLSLNLPNGLLVLSCPRCTLRLGLLTHANGDEVVLFLLFCLPDHALRLHLFLFFGGGKTAPEAEAGDEAAALQSSFTSLL